MVVAEAQHLPLHPHARCLHAALPCRAQAAEPLTLTPMAWSVEGVWLLEDLRRNSQRQSDGSKRRPGRHFGPVPVYIGIGTGCQEEKGR